MTVHRGYSNSLTTSVNREFDVSYSIEILITKAEQFMLNSKDIQGKFTINRSEINDILSRLTKNQCNVHLEYLVEELFTWKSYLNHQALTEKLNRLVNAWLMAISHNTPIDVILDLLKCISLNKKLSFILPDSQSKNLQLFLFSLVTETVSLHQETKLQYALNHDPLTNLPNTNLMMDKLNTCFENEVVLENVKDKYVGLMSINFEIEKLTSILVQMLSRNLNITASSLIQSALQENTSLFQLSNLQFAIVIEDLSSSIQLNLLATKIQRVFEQVLVIENKSLRAIPIICCSYIKKSAIKNAATGPQELVQNIEAALESALTTNQNFVMHSPKITEAIEAQKRLEIEVIEAFNNDNFSLYFQPIANLPDETCAGAEVLLRCQQTFSTNISPGIMIEVINKVGLGEEFTRWLINTTCRLGSELILEHKLPIYLTLNLRVEDLHNVELPHLLSQTISLWGLSPKDLILEITEIGILEENEKTSDNIKKLASLGFKLALDDFGTGYSSLARLRSMPISLIKVDQSFVRNIARSPEDYEIVKSISLLAASLGKEALVEGVEDIDCLNLVKELQFKKVQGYYFSKPLPFNEFLIWAKAHTNTPEVLT